MTPEKTKLSLWDIESGLHELMEAREEADATGILAIDQAILDYIHREIEKVDGVRAYLKHCDIMAKAAREEANRQQERAQRWESRRDRLRTFCLMTLEAFGRKRLEGRTGSISIRANGGLRPLVITSEADIPERFKIQVVSYQIDKAGLRVVLEAGETVPGAHLEERKNHIEVR